MNPGLVLLALSAGASVALLAFAPTPTPVVIKESPAIKEFRFTPSSR